MRRSVHGWQSVTILGAALAIAAGCAPPAPVAPAPIEPGPRPHEPRLPPIPPVDGPLELRVSYPGEGALVDTRGNNFIFGSTGSGEARLWINDREVEVQPNGGFLAFIPVPLDEVYRLRATRGQETTTLELPIRLPPPPPSGDTPVIVPGSVYPAGAWVALPGERIEVGFRGSAGGTAWLVLPDGSRVPLAPDTVAPAAGVTAFEVTPPAAPAAPAAGTGRGLSWYRGFFVAHRVVTADTTIAWPALTGEARPTPQELEALREREAGAPRPVLPGTPAESLDRGAAAHRDPGPAPAVGPGGVPATGAAVELMVAGTTIREPLPLNLLLADPERPRVGIAWDPLPPEQNGNERHIGRPGPGGGPFHYVWRNGTELELTGERDGAYRVRLTDDLTAWSPADKVTLSPPGAPPPASRVATVRMDPQPGWIDVRVGLTRRLPYAIEEGERSLSLLVFGAVSRANFLQHGRVDPYIERGEWSQPSDHVFRLDIHLAGMPWGYETFWGPGGDLILRVRRPPVIDPAAPLRGLTIGVDPGHGGADRWTMGPTGLTEADANLWIALPLQELLEQRGARVLMTRMTDTTVSLVQRTNLMEAEDADVFISIHNNAFPDGVNPWENNGTSVYYTHSRGAGLAWAVHEELLAELGLRDIGVGRADFHVTRMTWAPAILTEIMFMMIPEQEAALRDPVVQRRVAEAHVRGLVRWLRQVAPER
jgi:N-acetylmuramoyl-L-alanine amidase